MTPNLLEESETDNDILKNIYRTKVYTVPGRSGEGWVGWQTPRSRQLQQSLFPFIHIRAARAPQEGAGSRARSNTSYSSSRPVSRVQCGFNQCIIQEFNVDVMQSDMDADDGGELHPLGARPICTLLVAHPPLIFSTAKRALSGPEHTHPPGRQCKRPVCFPFLHSSIRETAGAIPLRRQGGKLSYPMHTNKFYLDVPMDEASKLGKYSDLEQQPLVHP